MTEKQTTKRTWDRHTIMKRGLDLILIGAMVYAALLAFGVVRRGGQFVEGKEAPNFVVQDLADGAEIKLSELRGKPVLINFFSTGCPSCRRELPHVAEIQAEAGDRLKVLVISADPPSELKSFMQQEGLDNLTVAFDRGAAHQSYNVDTIPYLVVIDKEGRIQGDFVGNVRWSDVEPWL